MPTEEIEEAAEAAATEEPQSFPPFMTVRSWLEAEVDMSDFGLTGRVYLRDATYVAVNEWYRCSSDPKMGNMHPTTIAKLMAAYVERSDDPSFPKTRAGWLEWDAWLKGGVHNKIVKRLADCIFKFVGYVNAEGGKAPN